MYIEFASPTLSFMSLTLLRNTEPIFLECSELVCLIFPHDWI